MFTSWREWEKRREGSVIWSALCLRIKNFARETDWQSVRDRRRQNHTHSGSLGGERKQTRGKGLWVQALHSSIVPQSLLPGSSSLHHHHPEHESLSLHATVLHFVQWMCIVSLRVSMKRRAESETHRQKREKREDGIFFLLLSFTCILHFFASTLAVFMLPLFFQDPDFLCQSFLSRGKRGGKERKKERIRRRRKKGREQVTWEPTCLWLPHHFHGMMMRCRGKSLNKKEPTSKLSMNRRSP